MTKATSKDFHNFNKEVSDFHHSLMTTGLPEPEIRKVLAPVLSQTCPKALLRVSLCLLLAILIYNLTNFEWFSWNLSAVARIVLIKILPLYNWTTLKNDKCLLDSSSKAYGGIPQVPNCDLCEVLPKIHVYTDIDPEILKSDYLDLHKPVIITGTIANWPNNTDFVTDLISNRDFGDSSPCGVATNLHNLESDVTTADLLLAALVKDNYFLHFRNCDLAAMKTMRSFTPRPHFLPPELSPIQYNWILWSKNYNSSLLKHPSLLAKTTERVVLLRQVRGSIYVELEALECEHCAPLGLTLKEGESVVISSEFWQFAYGFSEGENLSVILETH